MFILNINELLLFSYYINKNGHEFKWNRVLINIIFIFMAKNIIILLFNNFLF